MKKDIRWLQRFANYENALMQLKQAVLLSHDRPLSDLEKQGLIQSFEYTHELAWNTMKDFFEYQGNSSVKGSRDATREAFKVALISDGATWMQMIETRNQTSHAYDKAMAEEVATAIVNNYFPLFEKFQADMSKLKTRELYEP